MSFTKTKMMVGVSILLCLMMPIDEGPRDIAVESQEGKEVLVTGFKSLVHDDSSQVTTFKKRKRSNNARLRKK